MVDETHEEAAILQKRLSRLFFHAADDGARELYETKVAYARGVPLLLPDIAAPRAEQMHRDISDLTCWHGERKRFLDPSCKFFCQRIRAAAAQIREDVRLDMDAFLLAHALYGKREMNDKTDECMIRKMMRKIALHLVNETFNAANDLRIHEA